MNIENIETPEDVYSWMDENIQYGWLDLEGNEHIGEMKNFRKLYRTMSLEEILERKIGTCIEQVALMHYLLDKINVVNKMYCCRIFEPDDYGNLEEDEHMHCFILFYRNGKVFHLEHPNTEKKGIYEYTTEAAAIKTIVDYYIELRGGKESPTTQFYKVPKGVSFREFNAFINQQYLSPPFAKVENELRLMGIAFNKLTLIRQKDGVMVCRVFTDKSMPPLQTSGTQICRAKSCGRPWESSYILKYFDRPEYRREITNYQILTSLNIPTLKIIARTDRSLLMEDIDSSAYRLGRPEDVNNPVIAALIAHWYARLHKSGYGYVSTHSPTLYDECNSLTLENMDVIQKKTSTTQFPVWKMIEEHFAQILTVVMKLPTTTSTIRMSPWPVTASPPLFLTIICLARVTFTPISAMYA